MSTIGFYWLKITQHHAYGIMHTACTPLIRFNKIAIQSSPQMGSEYESNLLIKNQMIIHPCVTRPFVTFINFVFNVFALLAFT